MNINKLSSNIQFKDIEHMYIYELHIYAMQNKLYSNWNFLEYFKDSGSFFWSHVILHSTLKIKKLFAKYNNYLMDPLCMQEIVNEEVRLASISDNNAFKINAKRHIKEYFDEYSKYNKTIR